MSRWAGDPEAAADRLIERCLDAVDLRGRVLLANQAGALPPWLAERGIGFTVWNRRLTDGASAQAWPPPGPFDLALLRLAKAKDEQEMAAHAALSALAPGGRLVLYGGNDEGIRSAGGMLERLCGGMETLAARGHGRVLAARRTACAKGLRAALADWGKTTMIEIGGGRRSWVFYPGLFAADRIDEGTALLIGALPSLPPHGRLLDYGCGAGAIAASALAHAPGAALEMMDNDTVALVAAGENVPQARPILGRRLADAGRSDYDAILSNPPLHRGIVEDHGLLHQLIADAPRCLKPGGVLQIVVQRRVPLEALLANQFATATVAAENGRFRVWQAHRA